MFPTAKAPPKHTTQMTATIHVRMARRRIMCKRSRSVIFKPRFKSKQSKTEPSLVYMSYISKSSTVVFFRDLYDTSPNRLFDVHLPKEGEKYISPPMHCNGLFVLPTVNHVLVCNPTTKKAITLPQSSGRHIPRIELKENEGLILRVGFGFLQSTQAYKVAQFFFRSYNLKEKTYSIGIEVFTLGISKTWRVLAKDPPYPIWNSCSTFTGNCIYFCIWYPIAPYAPNAFLRFHLRNEKFSLLHPPCSMKHVSVGQMTLTNFEGRLCLYSLSKNNTKFSMFTSTKHGMNLFGWTPMFSFDIALQPGDVVVTPILGHLGKLLIHINDMKNPRRLQFYYPESGSFEPVKGSKSKDLKMAKDGFTLLARKPWFYVSSYDETFYELV